MPEEVQKRLAWERVRQVLELLVRAIGPAAALIDALTRK
jgi:hypothetical protein